MNNKGFQTVYRYCTNCPNKYDEDDLNRLFEELYDRKLSDTDGVGVTCMRCNTELKKSGIPLDEDKKTQIFERDVSQEKLREWGRELFE